MAYYNSAISNQTAQSFSLITAGLNQDAPAISIPENHLTDALDVVPYNDHALQFYADPKDKQDFGYSMIGSKTYSGTAVEAICDKSQFGDTDILYVLSIDGTDKYIEEIQIGTFDIQTYDITSIWGADTPTNPEYDSCLFSTEATNYVVFISTRSDRLFYFDGTTTGHVALDFTPKRCVSHANRVFIIDINNVLWWCKAGDLKTWYGAIGTDSFDNQDAGYWRVETERRLVEMCVLNSDIYLFGDRNIHIFRGFSYESFNLQMIIPNIGIFPSPTNRQLAVINNVAYFISAGSTDESGGTPNRPPDIYEFDGKAMPRIIHRPEYQNGEIINGIGGSIKNTGRKTLSATTDGLYSYNPLEGSEQVIFVFDIKSRSWWKRSNFYTHDIRGEGEDLQHLYVPSADAKQMYAVVTNLDDGRWYAFNAVGSKNSEYPPYIVTKAYYAGMSNKQTLTSVILTVQGEGETSSDEADSATIKVLYSSKYYDDDVDMSKFKLLRQFTDFKFNHDIQRIEIPVPVAALSQVMHYRLMVQIDGDRCILYNVERRFRVTRMTR